MIDVPDSDLDPLHERASVSVEMPLSVVVQDDVESVEVSLTMRAGLDLIGPAFHAVATFRIAEQTDISDDLADLGEFDSSLDGKVGVRIVNVAALDEDSTV